MPLEAILRDEIERANWDNKDEPGCGSAEGMSVFFFIVLLLDLGKLEK